jgi:hypothetical protein
LVRGLDQTCDHRIREAVFPIQAEIYRPEISWNETWNGTEQERVIEVSEDRLETNSVPAVSTLTGARTVFSLVWERAR